MKCKHWTLALAVSLVLGILSMAAAYDAAMQDSMWLGDPHYESAETDPAEGGGIIVFGVTYNNLVCVDPIRHFDPPIPALKNSISARGYFFRSSSTNPSAKRVSGRLASPPTVTLSPQKPMRSFSPDSSFFRALATREAFFRNSSAVGGGRGGPIGKRSSWVNSVTL